MSRSRSKSPSHLMQEFEPIADVNRNHKGWLNMDTKLELILKSDPGTKHRGTIPANAFRGNTVKIVKRGGQELEINRADIEYVRLIKIGRPTDLWDSYSYRGGKRTRNNKKKLNKSKRARR